MTIDDKSASSILHRQAPATPRGAVASRIVKSRMPFGSESVPRARTLQQLMQDTKAPDRDLQWLKDSLQIALQLELATLPPYLTAFWTIKDSFDPVAESITEIWREEMGHFGLACNLLTAIGGTPKVADATVVPTYPGSLPGGVRPSLTVTLRRLDVAQAAVFMDIEYPAGGPVAFAETVTYDSIGEFYSAILAAFNLVQPPLSLDRQLNSSSVGVFKIGVMADVERAINLINLQGEGSNKTPEEAPGDLAHFYRFGEIHHQKRFVKNDVTGGWGYDGDPVTLPDIWDMADIPPGGYKQVDVPDLAIWDLILRFDQEYSEMLRLLEQAWLHGQGSTLGQAIGWMRQMGDTARELLTKARTDGKSYGPCFRYVP